MISAAREAVELAEREGEHDEAEDLATITAEVVEVVEAPSVEKLEQMLADLSEHLKDRFDELEAKQGASEEKREQDQKDDLVLNVFLWFLTICLALFVFLLENLPT